jgi:hypothetical protein
MNKILLTSVFKPFGVDNIYSRSDSKIELYHNQLTRAQGVYSMRAFMNSYGIHAIANNIEADTTVLDFPSLKKFRSELKKGYDIVGIGAIMPNFQKVKKMVKVTREVSPKSKIVLGGFCASVPEIEKIMDVDHVCVGEGISFMRDLLGQPPGFEFKNPDVYAESKEILGVPVFGVKNPHIVVGLGCSYGCDFCSPSHFFGRKHIRFFESGKKLFDEMVRVEKHFNSNLIAFIGDDNFLLDQNRAEELRQCVVDSGKIFNLFLFGSSTLVDKFTPEKLAEMGTGTIWIGRESKFSDYSKNKGRPIKEVVEELRYYGVKVILSSILLTDHQTQDNIMEDIEEHLDINPAFSQFALMSPTPGTPLYDRMEEQNTILSAIPFEEWHAFKQPWFIHPEFDLMSAEKIQKTAYERDFLELGPSLMRFIETDLIGWKNLKDSQKPHLRARAKFFADNMWKYRILLNAMRDLATNDHMRKKISGVLENVESSFAKTNFFEWSASRAIHIAGRTRELRTRLWGDAIQPKTIVKKYNNNSR